MSGMSSVKSASFEQGWPRVTRRLYDDAVKMELPMFDPLTQFGQGLDQILPHRAADAAVEHLDDFLIRVEFTVLGDQSIVDRRVSEFVLDDSYLLAMRGRQDVVEESCLA